MKSTTDLILLKILTRKKNLKIFVISFVWLLQKIASEFIVKRQFQNKTKNKTMSRYWVNGCVLSSLCQFEARLTYSILLKVYIISSKYLFIFVKAWGLSSFNLFFAIWSFIHNLNIQNSTEINTDSFHHKSRST